MVEARPLGHSHLSPYDVRDATIYNGPCDIWESFKESPDIDHAKMAFYGVARHLVSSKNALKKEVCGDRDT